MFIYVLFITKTVMLILNYFKIKELMYLRIHRLDYLVTFPHH